MITKQFAYPVVVAGGVCSSFGGVLAQDAATKPHVPLEKSIG